MNDTNNIKRCAIYCCKYPEHYVPELQRAHCERYIKGEHPTDWAIIEKHYDDDLFDGPRGRPGRQELLADIKAGKVDVVLTYKIGCLAPQLLELADIFKVFKEHDVTFAAVAQNVDTSLPADRFVQNVIMSLAQFEREVADEENHGGN